jgi:uridine kinase
MYNLTLLLQDKSPKVGKTTFIAVDGHGGSGKSSLAQLLAEKLYAEIIHTDDFASWDNPTEWHPILTEKVFLPIQRGATTLSYERSKWWDNHHPEPVQNQPVTNIMILEGVSSLRIELREYISLGIFVYTPREQCLERGIIRDMQTGKTRDEVLKLWNGWLDSEDTYFAKDEPQKYADVVVDGTKPFREQIILTL